MDNDELNYGTESRLLKNDKIMSKLAVDSEKERWANLLKNGIGQDMKDVLSGKKKVKLTFKEKFNYTLKYYKNKIKKHFSKNEEVIY